MLRKNKFCVCVRLLPGCDNLLHYPTRVAADLLRLASRYPRYSTLARGQTGTHTGLIYSLVERTHRRPVSNTKFKLVGASFFFLKARLKCIYLLTATKEPGQWGSENGLHLIFTEVMPSERVFIVS